MVACFLWSRLLQLRSTPRCQFMNPRRITPEILDSLPSSDPDAQASRRDLQRLHSILGQKKLGSVGSVKNIQTAPPPAWSISDQEMDTS